jgi:hypothetical protein
MKNYNRTKSNNKSKSNKPYINYSVAAPRLVRSKLFDFIAEEYRIDETSFSWESWVLLGHILNCSSYKQYLHRFEGREAYLIPIPRDLRDSLKGERGGHREFLVPLSEVGLIHIYPFSKEKHECYSYEVDFKLRREYMRLMVESSFQSFKDGIEVDLVDLAFGKPVNNSHRKEWAETFYDENKNKIDNKQTEVIKRLQKKISVNIQLAFDILIPQRDALIDSCDLSDQKKLHSIESDLMNLRILQERAERYEYQRLVNPFNGRLEYFKILDYYQCFNTPHYLGRIYDHKAAYINLSSEIKSALRYSYYKGQMQYNYDLAGCYPNILKSLAERYNILDPLFEGQDVKVRRKEISKELSVKEKLIKGCFNSAIFGALVPSQKQAQKELEKPIDGMITIPKNIFEHSNNEDEYFRILDSLRPKLKAYQRFIKKVIEAWCSDENNYSRRSYINGVGRKFPKKKKYSKDEQNKLQTFVLQGMEGSFIQELILMEAIYPYECTHCEHDGITAVGTIPAEAIDRAKFYSGFQYAILELKDNLYQHLIKDKTT